MTAQTLGAYEAHVAVAPILYFRKEITRLSDGTVCAFNLTTEPEADRETRLMRAETARAPKAPLWIALPAQILACLAYALFVVLLCAGAIVLAPAYLLIETCAAIGRGLRWVLC